MSFGRGASTRLRATVRSSPVAPRSRRGGRFGRGPQPGLGEVGGVGETRRLADDDADAGAPVASGAQLFDSAVVEPGRRGPPVLDEDLREVTAGAQRGAENALNYGGIEH